MTGEELNILSKIKVRPVEEQRDFLLEQNMLLAGKIATLEKENAELKAVERMALYSKMSDKLTKAKVALRNVINYLGQFCSDYPDCVIEAEQFLKDN